MRSRRGRIATPISGPVLLSACVIDAVRQTRGNGVLIDPSAPALKVVVTRSADAVVITVSGELDLMTVPVLAGQLASIAELPPRRLVFDLGAVEFIDCAAARLICQAGQFLSVGAPSSGAAVPSPAPGPPGRPVLRAPSRAVRRVLEITGLISQVDVER